MAILPSPPPPIIPLIAEYPRTVVIASVASDISDGTLSGNHNLYDYLKRRSAMLCAVSMIFGLISLMLLSTRRAINGKAAITSGTTVAGVPTTVPTIRRVSRENHYHKYEERHRAQKVD